MARGVTPGARIPFVLEEDREKDAEDPERSIFFFRTLTVKERSRLESLVQQGQAGEAKYLALRAGLVGWERYVDQNGAEMPFETEGKQLNVCGKTIDPPTENTLTRLAAEHQFEISAAILDGTRLTRDEVKNS